MRPFRSPNRLISVVAALVCIAAGPAAQTPSQPARIAVTVTPDRPDWTYQPGAPVKFRIDVLRDGDQVAGASVNYSIGQR